jgi:hypothetical protein
MPHLSQEQTRLLGTYPLSRDGIDMNNVAHLAPRTDACWTFALLGRFMADSNPLSPDGIISALGGQVGAMPILDVRLMQVADDQDPVSCHGLHATATDVNHPNWIPQLQVLRNNVANAVAGHAAPQKRCNEAILSILAISSGLVPAPVHVNDRYRLHMASETWFGYGHFALSFRPEQPGRPRIFIQKTSDTVVTHACDTIWDEHLDFQVSVSLQELHQEHVDIINLVLGYGNLCIQCGAEHGFFNSHVRKWHRCAACAAVYCCTCGYGLAGGGGLWGDGSRRCRQPNCLGRTQLIVNV